MASPVYVYYELTNFYQNHRRYVKSVSANQLAGELDAGQLADSQNTYLQNCDPLRTVTENGTTRVLDPCGLIANSFFNGAFSWGVRQYQDCACVRAGYTCPPLPTRYPHHDHCDRYIRDDIRGRNHRHHHA